MSKNAAVVPITGPRGRRQIEFILEKYHEAHPDEEPGQVEPHLVAEWAVKRRIYERPPVKPEDRLRREIARYLKTEYVTDPQGRHVRKHHAVVYYVDTHKGLKRRSKWYELFSARAEEIQAALQLRRRMAFQDVKQLNLDFESYNENNVHGETLDPMDFNFNKDLEESKLPTTYPDEPPVSDLEDEFDEEDLDDEIN